MTKQQELLRYRQLVKELGDDSYTGKWMREQLPFLQSCMKGDVYPESHGVMTMAECNAQADIMIERARVQADKLISQAKAEAEQIVEKAKRDRAFIANVLIDQIREQLRKAESL